MLCNKIHISMITSVSSSMSISNSFNISSLRIDILDNMSLGLVSTDAVSVSTDVVSELCYYNHD